jgi:integrase
LRASEACKMQWPQIDLDARTLRVLRAKHGKESIHTLDRDELRDLRKLREMNTGLLVFETEFGKRLSVDNVQRIVHSAGEAAGLGHVHPHQLRHAAGFALVNQGLDTRLIQDFLGHKHIASTTRYTDLDPKRLAAVRVR